MNRIFPLIFPLMSTRPNVFNGLTARRRIRDKIAASKKKGMWMGGVPPLGYRGRDRKLVIIDSEAELVRSIFRRCAELGSVRLFKGRARSPGTEQQVVDERWGSPDRRQAILSRCALPDAAQPPL